jgi:hypothetical protein
MKYLLIYPIGMVLTMALWRFVPGFDILLCMVTLFILNLIVSTIGFLVTGKWNRW